MVVAALTAFYVGSLMGKKPARWQWAALVVWVAVSLLIKVGHR